MLKCYLRLDLVLKVLHNSKIASVARSDDANNSKVQYK